MAIERVGLLDSNDSLLNSDYDFSAFELRLTDNTGGVLFDDVDIKTEFDLSGTSGDVTISAGNAIIVATRATSTPIANKKIAVRYQLSDTKTLTGTGTKIYIELDQTLIDDPTLIEDTYPSIDYAQGKNIGTMVRGTERPTTNPYIKLWEYTDGNWVDNRDYPKLNGEKIDLSTVAVLLTGNQTVAGVKTLLSSPIVPTPTTDMQVSTKKYVDDNLALIGDQHKLTNSDFMTGEALVEGDSIFLEEPITFAEADQSQLIGDVAGNTRVSFPGIGSGIASNNLKLALAKNGSPTAFLRVRLETDNAGSPSGTLVDANATADIDPATLTTSLADTTVTFPGSFTVANGTKVHTVVSAVGDVVNGSNYYKIGVAERNTSVRTLQLYNGTNWIKSDGYFNMPGISPLLTSGNTSLSQGYKIKPNFNCSLVLIAKKNGCTATTAVLKNNAGSVIASATFVGNIAKFSAPQVLAQGTFYRVECNSGGASYTRMVDASGIFGNTYLIEYVTGSSNGEDISQAINIEYLSLSYNDGINTIFPYVSSGLFENSLLSKTSAMFSYKLPDIPRIVDKAYSAGEIPKRDFKGISKHLTGLTKGTELFVSDTPGALSTTTGTNEVKVGDVIDSNELLLRLRYGIVSLSNNTVYQAKEDGMVVVWAYDGGTLVGYADYVNGTTQVAGLNLNASGATEGSITFPVRKGQYYKFVQTNMVVVNAKFYPSYS